MKRSPRITLLWVALVSFAHAWDYEGHRTVNQLALASLPAEFPEFVREPANAERIAFLSAEPDRWKNVGDLPLKHVNSTDHYFDIEDLADLGLTVETLPDLRQVFAAKVAFGRALHADRFPAIDPAKNRDRTLELPGFLPWAITEYYGKLKSAFSYLKVFEELGTPDEVANARANLVYIMGVMGHFVGDGAQPLHTTKHHNGWVGENPRNFTTWDRFHSWIDGGFNQKTGLDLEKLRTNLNLAQLIPATPRDDGRDPIFVAMVDYLLEQHAQVVPLYEFERAGKLKADGTPGSFDGRELIDRQLRKGGYMLGSLWLTAWRNAGPDNYLRAALINRRAASLPLP